MGIEDAWREFGPYLKDSWVMSCRNRECEFNGCHLVGREAGYGCQFKVIWLDEEGRCARRKERREVSMNYSRGLKPCPCLNHAEAGKNGSVSPELQCEDGKCCVVCRLCGLRGPTAKTDFGALSLWNALPRGHEEVKMR